MARERQGVLVFRSWGGRRPGAGRSASRGRSAVAHRRRAPHHAHVPVHVTLRASPEIPSLRGARVFAAVRGSLAAASKATFRVLHYSVQTDHVHLLIEADGGVELARGARAWRYG